MYLRVWLNGNLWWTGDCYYEQLPTTHFNSLWPEACRSGAFEGKWLLKYLIFHLDNLWIIYYFPVTILCCLQQCMAKRFDGSQQALDLNNIRVDPGLHVFIFPRHKCFYWVWLVSIPHQFSSFLADLVSQNIEVTLNRKNSMCAVIKIIEENIPEVQNVSKLKHVQHISYPKKINNN